MKKVKINMLSGFSRIWKTFIFNFKVIISNTPMTTYFIKIESNGNAPKSKITNKVSIMNLCMQEH